MEFKEFSDLIDQAERLNYDGIEELRMEILRLVKSWGNWRICEMAKEARSVIRRSNGEVRTSRD